MTVMRYASRVYRRSSFIYNIVAILALFVFAMLYNFWTHAHTILYLAYIIVPACVAILASNLLSLATPHLRTPAAVVTFVFMLIVSMYHWPTSAQDTNTLTNLVSDTVGIVDKDAAKRLAESNPCLSGNVYSYCVTLGKKTLLTSENCYEHGEALKYARQNPNTAFNRLCVRMDELDCRSCNGTCMPASQCRDVPSQASLRRKVQNRPDTAPDELFERKGDELFM